MRFTPEVALGAWIESRLGGPSTVAGTVGSGWDAYARLLHRPELDRVVSRDPIEVEEFPVTWRDVTEHFGTLYRPGMQWQAIAGGDSGQIDFGDGLRLGAPRTGDLGVEDLAVLARIASEHAGTASGVAAFWRGWGELNPVGTLVLTATSDPSGSAEVPVEPEEPLDPEVARAVLTGAPLLELPGRAYVLLDCAVDEFADPGWTRTAGVGWRWGFGPTPNLLWPVDRSWLVASEIDFDSTLVGGSRSLIDDILASELEAVEVEPQQSLALSAG